MILKINSWFGRLGNNLIQLRHVILIALFYEYNIEIPPHPFFNTIKIMLTKNTDNHTYIDTEGDNFFYATKIKKFDNKCFKKNIDKMKKILQSIFIIKSNDLPSLSNNDLGIHIRGGDIFYNNPYPNYIPPPLSYYTNIIDNENYEKIYLINDIDNNPCIELLKKKYTNIIHEKNMLIDDIKKILSAKNIVFSVGTFPCSLLFLTNHTQNVYYPSYSFQVKEILNYMSQINFHSIPLIDYKNTIGKWKNTKEQNKLLLFNKN